MLFRSNVVDTGDGKALGRLAGAYPAMVSSVLEQVSQATGFDIQSILTRGLSAVENGAATRERAPRAAAPRAAAPAPTAAAPSTARATATPSTSTTAPAPAAAAPAPAPAPATAPATPASSVSSTGRQVVGIPRGIPTRNATQTGSNLTSPASESSDASERPATLDWMRRNDKEE